ncbi:MAG: sel1 repeat family protein [Deltaproteobacteria bacterium]|nr:sel1 repeat family protein [Deltaproteobacteria bacterium]
MRALVILACTFALVACGNAAEKKQKKEQESKAFMEAETKARAEQEAKEAKAAIDKASGECEAKKAEGCLALGRLYFDGKGVPRDAKLGIENFKKACELKSQDGCRTWAQQDSDGKTKLKALSALCDLRDADGCIQGAALADELVKAGQLEEPKKLSDRPALQLLMKACNLGGAIGCTARGVALANDDPKLAVEALTKGCELGEPTACFQLSVMLAEGKGVKKKDPAGAAAAKKKACDAGLKEAC